MLRPLALLAALDRREQGRNPRHGLGEGHPVLLGVLQELPLGRALRSTATSATTPPKSSTSIAW